MKPMKKRPTEKSTEKTESDVQAETREKIQALNSTVAASNESVRALIAARNSGISGSMPVSQTINKAQRTIEKALAKIETLIDYVGNVE